MMRTILKYALILSAIVLAYLLYTSLMDPIEKNKEMESRYDKVIERLMKIRQAQEAYLSATDSFASDFSTLKNFIDTGRFEITTTTFEAKRVMLPSGLEKFVETPVKKVLSRVSIKDSLSFSAKELQDLGTVNVRGNKVKINMLAANSPFDAEAKYPEYLSRFKKKKKKETKKETGGLSVGGDDLNGEEEILEEDFSRPVIYTYAEKVDVLNGMEQNFINVEILRPKFIKSKHIAFGDEKLKGQTFNGNWKKETEAKIIEKLQNDKSKK